MCGRGIIIVQLVVNIKERDLEDILHCMLLMSPLNQLFDGAVQFNYSHVPHNIWSTVEFMYDKWSHWS